MTLTKALITLGGVLALVLLWVVAVWQIVNVYTIGGAVVLVALYGWAGVRLEKELTEEGE